MTSTQAQLDEAIRTYYETFDEAERLTTRSVGGRIELLRTRMLVSNRLAPGSRVLDIGGATGVHATWLAADGHHVTLIDPVPSHIEAASKVGTFEALIGDARALTAPDASVDAVLLLGPLYHLIARDERMRSLKEARRVLRPGGTIFAQAIGRLAAFTNAVMTRGFAAVDHRDLGVLHTGEWTNPGPGFPGGHFHTAAELREEVEESGFRDVVVHGVEGPNVGTLEFVAHDVGLELAGLELADRIETAAAAEHRDRLADASPHILAIGTR